jgi:deazaflavin-dependent oxidoreductase (nitroreductase family)
MPLPAGLARFNRVVTNRVLRPLARMLPGFGVLEHQGRRTGKTYQTPLNVWRHDDRLVVALTYGPEVDWLANVRRSDEAVMTVRGRRLRIGLPQRSRVDEQGEAIPGAVRSLFSAIGVTEVVTFQVLGPA